MIEILKSFGILFIEIAKAILQLLPFSSPYNLLKYLTRQGTIIGIAWIDQSLFIIAGFLPSIIIGLISTKFKIYGKIKIILCILIYCLTLTLFSSIIFWSIIGILLIIGIIIRIKCNFNNN